MIHNTKRQAAIESVDSLYSWSQNFGTVLNPFCLFLVLINYEDYQVTYADLGRYLPTLGYKEQGLVGEALVAYSDYPTEIERHIEQLITLENEELSDNASGFGWRDKATMLLSNVIFG